MCFFTETQIQPGASAERPHWWYSRPPRCPIPSCLRLFPSSTEFFCILQLTKRCIYVCAWIVFCGLFHLFFFPRQEEQALSGWYEAFYLSLLSKKYSQKKHLDICHKLSELSKESEGAPHNFRHDLGEKKVEVCLCNLDASLLAILYQSEKARFCCGNKHSPLCDLAQFKFTINHTAS